MEKCIIIGGGHVEGNSIGLALVRIKHEEVIIVDNEQEMTIIENIPYKGLDPKLLECQLECPPMPRKSDSQPWTRCNRRGEFRK